ncbi:serine/threonine-protein kinase [Ktedonospora formicarum]|nr:serine/threonine-protein kinase [Ktedonospora formicarum]
MNAEDLIGKVLGTCTLQQLIGQGGMGAVFLAQQSRPRRQVAVKVLFPATTLNARQRAAFLERFRRETDTAASLTHPNIVPVHEYAEQDGLAYLVMPYLNGGSLRDVLEREGRLPLAQVCNYLEQLAAALEVAHERGVIHRDIKPANVMLTQEGRLVLTDFGLVKILSEEQSAQVRLTGAGAPLGTPDYMAPEQVIGTPVDTRADLYSLGCVLYHLVTGSPPFKGALPMQVAMQHLNNPPSSPCSLRPDLPASAEQVILRTLAKRPEDRYSHVQEITRAFRAALDEAGVSIGETLKVAVPQGDASFTKRGLFDPMWQKNNSSQGDNAPEQLPEQFPFPAESAWSAYAASGGNAQMPQPDQNAARNDVVAKTSMTLPSFTGLLPPEIQATPAQPTPVAPGLLSGTTNFGDSSFGLPNSFFAQNQPPQTPGVAWGQEQSPAMSQEDFSQSATPFNGTSDAAPAPSIASRSGGLLSQFATSSDSQTANGSSFSSFAQPQQEQPGEPAAPSPSLFSYAPKSKGLLSFNVSQPEQAADVPQLTFNAEQPLSQEAANPEVDQNPAIGTEWQQPAQSSTGSLSDPNGQYANQGKTGLLAPIGAVSTPGASGTTSMLRLMQPARVFKIPVAGKPGQYVTGMLPQLPANMQAELQDEEENLRQKKVRNRLKMAILIVAAAMIVFGGSLFWLVSSRNAPQTTNDDTISPSVLATSTARAKATAAVEDNILLEDSLSANIHDWPVSNGRSFKDGAYHIINLADDHPNTALLGNFTLPDSFVYTVTMNVLKDDDGAENKAYNEYGIIFRYQKIDKSKQGFYLFDIRNSNDSRKYQLWKYDERRGVARKPGRLSGRRISRASIKTSITRKIPLRSSLRKASTHSISTTKRLAMEAITLSAEVKQAC